MKQKSIGFRELLDSVLPLDPLPPADRLLVQRALQSGIAGRLEAAALHVIDRLEQLGELRRLPAGDTPGNRVLRFQLRGRFEIIRWEVPGPEERDGILAIPRASLPARVPAGLEQVRRLLHLDDPELFTSPRGHQSRALLSEQLEQASRDLLGDIEVRFFPASGGEENGEGPMHAGLAAQARAQTDRILYCPDATASRALESAMARRDLRSIALAGAATVEGDAIGHLEVRAAPASAFDPDALARIALLADVCGGLLDRTARLEKLVFVDPMTGVYNRAYFEQQAANEMARAAREQSSMALCIADIDDFKAFNTRLGYEAGNQVLTHVAHAIRGAVRPFDTVARWGGEEFAVLLSAPVQAEDVRTVSDRLRATVERAGLGLVGLDGRVHHAKVTVSIGVALFPEHASTVADLWRLANQALLVAKRPPKNRVVIHCP